MLSNSVTLPNGQQFLIHMDYTSAQAKAVTALVITSVISLTAVVVLLAIVAISAIRTYHSREEGLFIRSHVAGYFVSLLITDLLQAIGSIMNARWMKRMGVDYGDFCTAQGVIKQAADVGTATWVLIIAMHTFTVLFLRLKLRRYVMWVTLLGGWSFVGAIVIAGPAALNTVKRGPYFGISGFWCWISNGYPVERITMEYMILFLSAIFSFVCYTLVFLRLRGNIRVAGRRILWRSISRNEAWQLHSQDSADAPLMRVAKQMLLYPVAYTILIVPIAACRFAEWTGHTVPFAVLFFADAVFLLSGFVNALLFLVTRRILPPGSILPSFISTRRHSGASVESTDVPPDDTKKERLEEDVKVAHVVFPPSDPEPEYESEPESEHDSDSDADSEATPRPVPKATLHPERHSTLTRSSRSSSVSIGSTFASRPASSVIRSRTPEPRTYAHPALDVDIPTRPSLALGLAQHWVLGRTRSSDSVAPGASPIYSLGFTERGASIYSGQSSVPLFARSPGIGHVRDGSVSTLDSQRPLPFVVPDDIQDPNAPPGKF